MLSVLPMFVSRDTLDRYLHHANRAVNWLLTLLNPDGSFRYSTQDLACYYKSPYLFFLSGQGDRAQCVLEYIRQTFMQPDGDFRTSPGLKSENPALSEYWAYMNGWIAIAAQKMGRFDVSYPAVRYLESFYHPIHGGFTTRQAYRQGDNSMDVLTTAHLGLASLYVGDMTKALAAGHLLPRFLSLQPDPQKEFLLRLRHEGALVTEFSPDQAPFYSVSLTEPDQAYFMLGYPVAFLGKLFDATGDGRFLHVAKEYLDLLLTITGNIRSFHFSHKVAWAAAILARITKDERYVEFAKDIVDHLLSIQDQNGGWLPNQPLPTQIDQTAEIAIWLQEIVHEWSVCIDTR